MKSVAVDPVRNSVRLQTTLLFVVLLAGQFSFSRIGLENPVVIPERLFALLLLWGLSVLTSIGQRRGGLTSTAGIALPMIPLGYYLLTAIWAQPTDSLASTIVDLVCMVISCLIAATLARRDFATTATTFLWCMLVAALLFSLAGLGSAGAGRLSAFGGGPNVYSRITMMGVIGVSGLIALRRIPLWAIAAAPVVIAATILSGSRGSMLAGLCAIAVLLPLVRRLRVSQVVAILLTLGLFALLVYRRYSDVIDETINGRIVHLTLQDHYTSGRDVLSQAAETMFQLRPWTGWGLQGFSYYYGNGFTYPHNIVLQTAAEGGAIGLMLLFAALIALGYVAMMTRQSDYVICFTAGSTLYLVASLFSGGYYDARFLWVFGVLLMMARNYHRADSRCHSETQREAPDSRPRRRAGVLANVGTRGLPGNRHV